MGAGDSAAYREALRRARLLQPDERLRLIEEPVALVCRNGGGDGWHSTLKRERG